MKFKPGRYDGCVGIQKEINGYKTFVILSHCQRPNLAATAEAKDLTAPTADEERGARSPPKADQDADRVDPGSGWGRGRGRSIMRRRGRQ